MNLQTYDMARIEHRLKIREAERRGAVGATRRPLRRRRPRPVDDER